MSTTPQHTSGATPSVTTDFDVIVVGAGFGGLYMLHRLRGLGLKTVVLEAGDGVGGTWYWNRYPGARCDVESKFYSYSFDEELQQEWEWSERYASQPEILRYLEHVADRFDLLRDIRLGTRVTAAHLQEDEGVWSVGTDTGEELTSRYCVMATGSLSVGKDLEFEGLEDFEGACYRTSRWPHEGVDFTGKRVAIIGTGSSGVQSIPAIAQQAAQVTVLQRTAGFTLPAHNRPLTADDHNSVKADYPALRQASRTSALGIPASEPPTLSALEASPEDRTARYQERWDEGAIARLSSAFTDLTTDMEANATAVAFIHSKIREIVKDPATAEKLLPRDYPFGAKRTCFDTGYYAAFNRDNVELVDVRATPITRVTAKGVATTETEYPVDALVFATGFDAMTGALLSMDIRGRAGLPLRDKWAAGPRTYLGLGIQGFPNLFLIAGPGSPSVLSNVVASIEQHVEWISECLDALRGRGATAIEATEEAENTWVDHVNAVSAGSLFMRADSWYLGANVPGKPRVFMPYAGGVGTYRKACDKVAANGYEGFDITAARD
ncbi:flavin-containing monooxygenase [Streptomyces albipurpureus]|uniref:NAD(P)/FAD-dependent oxidoreductase n=1 Tax=Streptomyces albipurpureus TaxID=2897419 RepID=A0ABT0UZ22_9ACTN|nr:NAD(P)/FAD-dependent oxidoreductase [Streptomyces sp. CWNU-1]MCM2393219.1 NAD(P)/FAD-dependent oxidoreductase [Streptomyces sp. CWNU-1]